MSTELLSCVQAFIAERSNAEVFAENFMTQWKKERGRAQDDVPWLSEVLSTIFCLTDLFNANDDRDEWELDEFGLRTEIERVLLEQGRG